MTAHENRVDELKRRVAGLTQRRMELREEIGKQKRRLNAKKEVIRAEAQAIIDRTTGALEPVETQLTRATLELTLAQAQALASAIFDAMKEMEVVDLTVGGVGSPESDRAVAKMLADLGSVRAMQNLLKGRAGDLVELLRPFVMAHFKAYTHSDDPEKRYPAWFADAALWIALLQDNPLYALTVEQLVELVGLDQATKFFKVDYGAVEEMARKGLLKDKGGKLIDLEQLAELRQRTERTPRLELKPRGDQPIENLLDLIDPKFATRGLTIDALGLDTATENALRAASYTMVEQARASFDTLQSIRGIGPKRAERIINALVARAAAA
ncbi:MAG: hypothetical protein Q7S02_01365 [bacterium]|nr:hypothetical protein [bacterium]